MIALFYYIGIIYIITYVKNIYDTCTDINDRTTIEELQKIQDSIQTQNVSDLTKGANKNIFISIMGMITIATCYWWIIYGYLYTPESKLFLAIIIISIAFIITLLFQALKLFSRHNMMEEIRNGNFVGGMKNIMDQIKTPYQIAFNIINRFAKVAIASYIVYNHFFTT